MSDARYLNAPQLRPPAGHYSHAVCANGFVFVAGQIPVTPTGEKLVDAPFETQVRQVLSAVPSRTAFSADKRGAQTSAFCWTNQVQKLCATRNLSVRPG